MATIKAQCSECLRDVEDLRESAILMTIFDSGVTGYYSFFCPHCSEESQRALTDGHLLALSNAGVRTHTVHVPEEFLEEKGGPPISPDDILDFHIAINAIDLTDEWAKQDSNLRPPA